MTVLLSRWADVNPCSLAKNIAKCLAATSVLAGNHSEISKPNYPLGVHYQAIYSVYYTLTFPLNPNQIKFQPMSIYTFCTVLISSQTKTLPLLDNFFKPSNKIYRQ